MEKTNYFPTVNEEVKVAINFMTKLILQIEWAKIKLKVSKPRFKV